MWGVLNGYIYMGGGGGGILLKLRTPYPQSLSLIKLTFHCCALVESHHLNMRFNPCLVYVVLMNDVAAIPHHFSGNQLLNDRRTDIQVVTSETFASDSISIDVSFTSGQVRVKCVFLKIMHMSACSWVI